MLWYVLLHVYPAGIHWDSWISGFLNMNFEKKIEPSCLQIHFLPPCLLLWIPTTCMLDHLVYDCTGHRASVHCFSVFCSFWTCAWVLSIAVSSGSLVCTSVFILFFSVCLLFLSLWCSALQSRSACAVSCSSQRLLVALLEDHSPALPVVSSLQTIVAWFCPFSFVLNCSCWTQSKCGTSYSIVAQPSFWILTVYYKILFAWIYTLTKLNIIILMFFFHFFFVKCK